MKIRSKYFHDIDYEASDILHFPNGLFGFEQEREFLLLSFAGSEGTLLCFQSIQTPALAFVAVDPFHLCPDYAPELSAEELRLLGVSRSQELCFYALCVVREPVGDSTVNLRCPIAVNDGCREAMQVILDTGQYHMRHKLSDLHKEGAARC